MNPEHDQDDDEQIEETVRPRRLVSSRLVRGAIVFGGMAVIAAIALPYALDWSDPPLPRATAVTGTSGPAAVAPAPTAPAPAITPPPSGPAGSAPAPAASAPPALAARVEVAQAVKPAAPPAPAPATTKEPPGAARQSDAPKTPAKTAAKSQTAKKEPASRPAVPTSDAKVASETYWVQVGAFKDEETANRLAGRLREQNFRVRQSTSRAAGAATSTPAPAAAEAPKSSADRYEVIVSGASPADVNAKLGAKGLAFQSGPDGAVITPSLPLGEAVALSKDLSGENLAVKVRRVVPARAAATVAIVEGGETLHRVRVGSFPDRASAQAALRDLEAKGYKPFLARGSE